MKPQESLIKEEEEIPEESCNDNPDEALTEIDIENVTPIIENKDLSPQHKAYIITKYFRSESQLYKGPIPPAAEIRKYEDILPGSADRILKMAETQSNHRMALTEKVYSSQLKESGRGQWMGFVLCLVFIGISGWWFYMGKTLAALIVISVTLLSVLAFFFKGKISIKKDSEEVE